MTFFLPTTGSSTQWGGDMWMARGTGTRLTIAFSQEMLNMKTKGNKMRVVFDLEIKAEIDSYDLKQREVFVRLMSEAAKQLHTKAVLLSQHVSPNMKVTVSDTSGIKTINIFAGEKDNV
jgi:hypothetical protein